jgi:hypothetical protein
MHSMLYTINCSLYIMIYINGQYHGISNGIHVRLYHGIYHIVSVHSSLTASISSIPCAALFLSPLQRLNCSLPRFGQMPPTPLCSFYHSELARLPPPIAPHPEVELIEHASVASPLDSPGHAGICSSSSPVAEAVGQGWMCVTADIARHQWHTSEHILCSANVQAG